MNTAPGRRERVPMRGTCFRTNTLQTPQNSTCSPTTTQAGQAHNWTNTGLIYKNPWSRATADRQTGQDKTKACACDVPTQAPHNLCFGRPDLSLAAWLKGHQLTENTEEANLLNPEENCSRIWYVLRRASAEAREKAQQCQQLSRYGRENCKRGMHTKHYFAGRLGHKRHVLAGTPREGLPDGDDVMFGMELKTTEARWVRETCPEFGRVGPKPLQVFAEVFSTSILRAAGGCRASNPSQHTPQESRPLW
ncbi:hypothetical protein Bbelb_135890 [Branchiostoma belcheri]|nr:hypothetical protein Bbelb_135890 [Branchiostoma belcheri]